MFRLFVVMMLAATLVGCSDGVKSPTSPSAAVVDPPIAANAAAPTLRRIIGVNAPMVVTMFTADKAVLMGEFSDGSTKEVKPDEWASSSPGYATINEDGEIIGVAKGDTQIRAVINGQRYMAPNRTEVVALPAGEIRITSVTPREGEIGYTRPGENPVLSMVAAWGDIVVEPTRDSRSPSGFVYTAKQINGCGMSVGRQLINTCAATPVFDCEKLWDYTTKSCTIKAGSYRFEIPVSEAVAKAGITSLDAVTAFLSDKFRTDTSNPFLDPAAVNMKAEVREPVRLTLR